MTTIVALHTAGRGTVIGGDSQITQESFRSYMPPGMSKIIGFENWAIGACGTLKVLNVLARDAELLFDRLTDIFELPERLAALMESAGFQGAADEYGGPKCFGQGFLVAAPHGAWTVDSSLAIAPILPGMLFATGSGREYAMGAGHASEGLRDPVKRVVGAIESAARFDPMTGGRIDVLEMRMPKGSASQ